MRSLSDGLHHAAVGAATPDGGPVTVTNLTLSNKPLGNRMSAKKAGCPSGLRGRIANPFVVGSNPTPAFQLSRKMQLITSLEISLQRKPKTIFLFRLPMETSRGVLPVAFSYGRNHAATIKKPPPSRRTFGIVGLRLMRMEFV